MKTALILLLIAIPLALWADTSILGLWVGLWVLTLGLKRL